MFENVIGYESVKKELAKVCDMVLCPDRYQSLKIKMPGGILIYGQPGVGKTTLAMAFIEELKAEKEFDVFVCRKNMPDGEFVNYITKTFEEAIKRAPSIVLLDDIDRFSDEESYGGNSESYMAVQSGIDAVKGKDVLVIATANDISNLPKSLLRTGRLGDKYYMDKPSGVEAERIIEHYLSGKPVEANVDVTQIAKLLSGRSCSDLETVINSAGIMAAYDKRNMISENDLMQACFRYAFNATVEPQTKDPEYLKRIALHEAGHTLVGELIVPGSVLLCSICSKADQEDSMGITVYDYTGLPLYDGKRLEYKIMTGLAGKAATEVLLSEYDMGSHQDIDSVFDNVALMLDDHTKYGFETYYWSGNEGDEFWTKRARTIRDEVTQTYYKVKKLLVDNREILEGLMTKLLEKKTLFSHEIRKITEKMKCF